jgi:hypothetical protein
VSWQAATALFVMQLCGIAIAVNNLRKLKRERRERQSHGR